MHTSAHRQASPASGAVKAVPFRCLICSEPDLQIVKEFSALPRVTSDAKTFAAGGTLSACANCGTVQKLPDQKFLDEIDGIYNSYNLYELAEGTEQVIFVGGAPRRRSEILVDLIQQKFDYSKLAKVIDIGCGNGAALRTLSRRLPNTKLWGSELSDRNEASLHRSQISNHFSQPLSGTFPSGSMR